MLFNVQKLFQTADNEVRVAGQEGHIEREGGKKKKAVVDGYRTLV